MSDLGTCRSCEAPIRWVRSESGKRHPLNADPDPANGAWWVDDDDVMHYAPEAATVDGVRQTAMVERDLFTSHFATCPNANQHRRKK
jgi:hypothetical protein